MTPRCSGDRTARGTGLLAGGKPVLYNSQQHGKAEYATESCVVEIQPLYNMPSAKRLGAYMPLRGNDLIELRDRLLGIASHDDLAAWTRVALDQDLDDMVKRGPIKSEVFELITSLERDGRLRTFIEFVARERPNRPDFQAFAAGLFF